MTENRKKPIIIAGPCSAESREQGMTLLHEAAAQKVREGVTTMEELMKVAYFV